MAPKEVCAEQRPVAGSIAFAMKSLRNATVPHRTVGPYPRMRGYGCGVPISRIPLPMKILMAIVIGVSVPEGLALLLGPSSWYDLIWGWSLTAMTARFTAGLYLTVALGFVMAWRDNTWESARIPLAMLWCFALIALGSAVYVITTAPGVIKTDRAFTWVWFFLYIVSAGGGFYYHLIHPKTVRAKATAPA